MASRDYRRPPDILMGACPMCGGELLLQSLAHHHDDSMRTVHGLGGRVVGKIGGVVQDEVEVTACCTSGCQLSIQAKPENVRLAPARPAQPAPEPAPIDGNHALHAKALKARAALAELDQAGEDDA